MKKILFIFITFFFIKLIKSETQKNGDVNGGFSVNLMEGFLIDNIENKVYIAISEKIIDTNKQYYGISQLINENKNFYPFLSSNAILNGKIIENPLFNTIFSNVELVFLNTILPKYILAAVPDESKNIYFIVKGLSYNNEKNLLLKTEDILDFNENLADIYSINTMQNGICVLANTEGKDFSDAGNNSVLRGYSLTENVVKVGHNFAYQTMLGNSFKLQYDSTIPAFNINSGVITLISNDIFSFGDPVLNTVYFGISGKGTNGIRAVTCLDQEIAPESAVWDNKIIASISKEVFVKNICTMHTSTGLVYLIVQVGEDDPSSLINVYALPIVNNPGSVGYKKLANVNSVPKNIFESSYPNRYKATYFSESAKITSDLYDSSNLSSKVGGGPEPLTSFEIQSIQSFSDIVFIKVKYAGINKSDGDDGIFYSQALFDENGAISSWTEWKRKTVVGDYDAAKFIPFDGTFMLLKNNTIGSSISKTGWNLNSPLQNVFENYKEKLNLSENGIQGVVDIPFNHPFVNDSTKPLEKPSFAILTGNNSIIIQQTSKNTQLLTTKNNKIFFNKDGSTSGFLNSDNYTTLIFKGGELKNSGSLVTSCLAYSNNDAWFSVGGSNGLYILKKNNGSGFGINGIGSLFKNLDSSFSWNKIGNFKNIKKVISTKNYIYVLTNDSFYRLNIVNGNNITTLKLFDLSNAKDTFSDFSVSGSLCLVGTTKGLFKNGIGTSIEKVSSGEDCKWTFIKLPESEFPPISIFTISRNGLNNSWANDSVAEAENVITGNVYVLAGSIGTHEMFLYRFVSRDTGVDGIVKEDSLKMLNNYFIKDVPSYYCRLMSNKLSLVGDGASWFSHSVQTTKNSFFGELNLIDPFLKNGKPFGDKKSITNPVLLNSGIGPVVYISGYGVFSAGSKLGVYALE